MTKTTAESESPPSRASGKVASVVFSFRNEEENIPELIRRTRAVFADLQKTGSIESHELIFVNDASTDRSEEMLMELDSGHNDIRIINMSRNFGVFPCTFAGFQHASGDVVIYMDSDLQDPPEIIPRLIEKWASEENIDVVHTVRTSRAGESWFKLATTRIGYWLLKGISNFDLPIEAGDFKLLSRRAVSHLIRFKEKMPYTRGLVCWVGFNQKSITYERDPRFSGETKFRTLGLGAITNFANSALISFSSVPLQISSLLGLFGFFTSAFMIMHVAFEKLSGQSIPGWTAIMTAVLFIGSIQLLATGVLGLYIHSIYTEVKGRPNYIIESLYGFQNEFSVEDDNDIREILKKLQKIKLP
jgi:glycosyltransferase involved in cell wall biosynthesis